MTAAGTLRGSNEPAAAVRAMIASPDGPEMPLRLPRGADTYRDVHAGYQRRLELLEAPATSRCQSPSADGPYRPV